jgi:DDE superfamily endonuclease
VTGQEKAGEAGVKRQYMGCAGRVANRINTVHLSYVRARTGHALIDARQWIPQEHIEDPVSPWSWGCRTRGAAKVHAIRLAWETAAA